MSKKSGKIAELIQSCEGQTLDAHYLGYFKCFNEALYYEAHDVLEELWLADRQGANYAFYKGLIQLAGAFVHLQKNRLRPSNALFDLARTNLLKYPAIHEHLDLKNVLSLIDDWAQALHAGAFEVNPLGKKPQPQLQIMDDLSKSQGTLLIATRNQHKVGEIRQILGEGYCYLTLSDLPGAPEVVEDAPTFAGNSRKKSVELAKWLTPEIVSHLKVEFPLRVLADDSGLEVDFLNGAPGVFSARFAAMDTGAVGNSKDADNNAKLLRLLNGVDPTKKSARFRCTIAVTKLDAADSPVNETKVQIFDGACEGRIAESLAGAGGFGYDPLFIPDGYTCSFAELGEEIKNKISHRAAALAKLKKFLDLESAPSPVPLPRWGRG